MPADVAVAEPEFTAADWKEWILGRFQSSTSVIALDADAARRGSPYAFASHCGRFVVDPADVTDLMALEATFHREFVERFAKAQIIDRRRMKSAPSLRLIVDNTRAKF